MHTKVVIPSMPNQEKKTYDMAILTANIVEKNSEILTPATVVSLQTILQLPLP